MEADKPKIYRINDTFVCANGARMDYVTECGTVNNFYSTTIRHQIPVDQSHAMQVEKLVFIAADSPQAAFDSLPAEMEKFKAKCDEKFSEANKRIMPVTQDQLAALRRPINTRGPIPRR